MNKILNFKKKVEVNIKDLKKDQLKNINLKFVSKKQKPKTAKNNKLSKDLFDLLSSMNENIKSYVN